MESRHTKQQGNIIKLNACFLKDKENEKLLGNSPRNKERKIQTTVSEMRDHTY